MHTVSISQQKGGQLYQLSSRGHRLQLYIHYFDLLAEGEVKRRGDVKEQSEVTLDAYHSVKSQVATSGSSTDVSVLVCTAGISPSPAAFGR